MLFAARRFPGQSFPCYGRRRAYTASCRAAVLRGLPANGIAGKFALAIVTVQVYACLLYFSGDGRVRTQWHRLSRQMVLLLWQTWHVLRTDMCCFERQLQHLRLQCTRSTCLSAQVQALCQDQPYCSRRILLQVLPAVQLHSWGHITA